MKDIKGSSLLTYILIAVFLLPFAALAEDPPAPEGAIGMEERLGEAIPLEITFNDETGAPVPIGSLLKKPTILSLAYFRCQNLCNEVMSNIAGLPERMSSAPGKDYSIITVSFNPDESNEDAARKKVNYVKAAGNDFPESSWRFLTGNEESIKKLASSIGFNARKTGDRFDHPAVLVILSPAGKIIRYIYGTSFLPKDVEMALIEAASGRVGPTIPKLLRICYSYDPKSGKFVFSILKTSGIIILFLSAVFFIYLNMADGKKNRA